MSLPSSHDSEQLGGGEDGEGYRLVAIEAARTPEGCAGRDWFAYRIAQGKNSITGYRQGSHANVSAEVETILAGLNGRRRWNKGKPISRVERRAANARRQAAQRASATAPAPAGAASPATEDLQ